MTRRGFKQEEPLVGEVVAESQSLVPITPGAGEIIDLRDTPKVAQTIRDLNRWREEVYDRVIDTLRSAVRDEADRLGQYTIRYGDIEVTVDGPDVATHHWEDVEGMLAELRKAGLPEERCQKLATETRSWKVDRTEANRIRKNPAYRAIIDTHDHTTPRNRSVRIR